jgi:soluble lytic murein transglycosylase-like protein
LSRLAQLIASLFLALAILAHSAGPVPPRIGQPLTPARIDHSIAWEHRQRAYRDAERVARHFYVVHGCNPRYSALTGREAVNNGLPPRLVAAVVLVESRCRADAMSDRGAVGLMQIHARSWNVSRKQLLDADFNMRMGTKILAAYSHEVGTHDALKRYFGLGSDDGNMTGEQYAEHIESLL